ncbi:MAG: tetratricopeptide repeat protein [Lentisphaerae bacterium]|jgi:hypothetical protein|nr:tetratricopeptide repeat protein [Lentisphaerota bacterium]MBT4822409.1 tetratricopeptide repeat protein [Lentisphaerota bacterium]MBT5608939.1 tetratricopeptide repeat protein [Lentisphaerota bacterium]MBT7057343.1 tetratricopeptide repeat protein [Lentisphaerota bacterium]MBT7847086.1 tetratricopeptide repeat protein [Lentisphaerota bacterium]
MSRFTLICLVLLAVAVRAESVAELLEKGIFQQEAAHNYGAAIVLFRKVIAAPKAVEAGKADALVRLGQCQVLSGQTEEARKTFQKLGETHPKQLGDVLVRLMAGGKSGSGSVVAGAGQSAGNRLRSNLRNWVVPQVELEETAVDDIVGFLARTSKELDPKGVGINFVWIERSPEADGDRVADQRSRSRVPGAGTNGSKEKVELVEPDEDSEDDPSAAADLTRAITMSADNIPLGEVIRYICLGAELHHRLDESAVVIAPKSVAISPMETRYYSVQAGILDGGGRRRGPHHSIDWGEDDDDDDDGTVFMDLKGLFRDFGMEFPVGSRVSYYQRVGKLIIHNTVAEHERIERILQQINVTPTEVRIGFELIEVLDPALVRDLPAGAVHEMALKALPGESWRVLHRASAVTLSGNTTVVLALEPGPKPAAKQTAGAPGEADKTAKAEDVPVEGATVAVTPTVAADGYSIDLELRYDVSDPTLPELRTETKVIVWDGESVTFQLAGGEAEDSQNLYLIVSATLLNPAGLPIRAPASPAARREALRGAMGGK